MYPETWQRGKATRFTSSDRWSYSMTDPSMAVVRLRWLSMAPLGKPVVPLVYTSHAMQSSSKSRGGSSRRRLEQVVVAGMGRADRCSIVDDDDVLDRGRSLCEERFDLREELRLHEQHACVGVVEDPGPLPRVQPVVEQREGHPGCGNAVVAVDVLREVLGEHGDAVTWPSQLAEGVGELPGGVSKLAEGDHLVVGDHGGSIGVLATVESQNLVNKHWHSSPRAPMRERLDWQVSEPAIRNGQREARSPHLNR